MKSIIVFLIASLLSASESYAKGLDRSNSQSEASEASEAQKQMPMQLQKQKLTQTPAEGMKLSFPFVPITSLTTGSLCNERDPDYKRRRYRERIASCERNVPGELKAQVYGAYGIPRKCRKDYTIDHFIPLSIGGSNKRDNLWPEPRSIKAIRKDLETELFEKVSQGKLSQAEAIRIIREAKLNPKIDRPTDFHFCR